MQESETEKQAQTSETEVQDKSSEEEEPPAASEDEDFFYDDNKAYEARRAARLERRNKLRRRKKRVRIAGGIVVVAAVAIRISDTGIGMSQDYLTKIFEAFTREKNTTKSKIAGTGLGMSIVKNYVDLLGGTIDVESELGKGSTFTVTLKHRIADERYYVKKHIEESGTGNEILEGRNILLAEDNDLNAEIAEAILERAGLRIERVENGIQCVNRILKMPAGTYDMIFMDIQMPQMDGYKATQTIRNLPDKDKACIPIIAMTANAFAEDKKKTMEAGMNAHLSKPLNVPELMETIRKFCVGKQMCQ